MMSFNRRLVFSLCFLVFLAFIANAGAAGVEVSGPSGKQVVSSEQMAKFPRARVTISDHGTSATFEGIELSHLLALVDTPGGEKLRGKELTRYVVVEGADGYRALFALAELDRAFADRAVLLADTRDGQPLSEKEGPFRVIVEGEKRQGRCVRQVTRITVAVAP